MVTVESHIATPFDGEDGALANSCYGRFDGSELLIDGECRTGHAAQEVHAALRALLHDPEYPCVGAKSIVNQASYRFGLYDKLASPESTAGLARDLYRFIEERPTLDGEFASYIASFVRPKPRRIGDFERLLWQQLKMLHELDARFHDWNPEVSADPSDAGFSFSFAGGAFFVVGLSPASSRWARHFSWPTLVFNDHFQFERLRDEQRFDRIRDVIRERDVALHGAPNAMLSDYGQHSEARQYSGRQARGEWKCPVHFDGATSHAHHPEDPHCAPGAQKS